MTSRDREVTFDKKQIIHDILKNFELIPKEKENTNGN